MQVYPGLDLGKYAGIRENVPEEAQESRHDLLSSMTHFFHDKAFFETLRDEVLQPLFANVPDDGIRAWTAGVAAATDAYSLAILLLEDTARRNVSVPIHIVASDEDESVRAGRFPRTIEADVSQERLSRFFIDKGTHYRACKDLRALVLFSDNNPLQDPPFTQLDLIICRDLLINLERPVRDRVLRQFHDGLRPGGALLLGAADPPPSLSDLFKMRNPTAQLYSALAGAGQRNRAMPLASRDQTAPDRVSEVPPATMPGLTQAAAADQLAPPGILVDAAGKIIQMSPGAGRFILPSGDVLTMPLVKVLRPELRAGFGPALDKARESGLPILSQPENVALEGHTHGIALHILPDISDDATGGQAMVIFIDAGPSPDDRRNDLAELMAAAGIGMLSLDTHMRIRVFTPPAADLFAITETDTGRLITDVTSRLVYDTLDKDARQVLRDLIPVETEVQCQLGRSYLLRIHPDRRTDGSIAGVVLSFVDISPARRIESDLRESQQNYQTLFDSIDEGFAIIKVLFQNDIPVNYRFIKVNSAFERQTGLANAQGKTARDMVPHLERYWPQRYGKVAISGEPERFEAPSDVMGRYFDVYAFPVGQKGAHMVGILFRDVSARKEAEQQRQLLTDELSHRVKNTLAVVQALARQPGSPQMTVEQYRDRFIGRIQALGHAHDQLLQTHWKSADLATLARKALAPYRVEGRRDVDISGPEVVLTPKQGLGLALILHELATNASTYGALSVEGGTLGMTWELTSVGTAQMVHLIWHENGGPPVEPAHDPGFGMRLIKQACTYELDGNVELLPLATGYHAEISFPMDRTGHG
ncbi:CheR family methyltransferase [Yoonia vestfoldensis]|uniref:CheR family methyltransferase n=1 Tax=Yoonia vestfoldensis TaxID=245188 RepID=UPI000363C164|nr:CheR family methyltransferase [Yoonia vestfoldensis]